MHFGKRDVDCFPVKGWRGNMRDANREPARGVYVYNVPLGNVW